jgi:hypothetical protein
MCKNVLSSMVAKIVDSSGFVISTGDEGPLMHPWRSGYGSSGAQPATPAMGVSPAKPEAVRASDNETIKKIFLMILSPVFLLEYDVETGKRTASP